MDKITAFVTANLMAVFAVLFGLGVAAVVVEEIRLKARDHTIAELQAEIELQKKQTTAQEIRAGLAEAGAVKLRAEIDSQNNAIEAWRKTHADTLAQVDGLRKEIAKREAAHRARIEAILTQLPPPGTGDCEAAAASLAEARKKD